jgi:hypothetical protein
MSLPYKLGIHVSALLVGLLVMGAPTVKAQLSDALTDALGGGSSSSGGSVLEGLGGPSMPSLGDVGIGNIAGVLEFCAKNKYLGGDGAGLKDKLLGKLGGQQKAQSDTGYQEGVRGILGGNSGKKVDLNGGRMKQQMTDKVCDQVLDYGKSLT